MSDDRAKCVSPSRVMAEAGKRAVDAWARDIEEAQARTAAGLPSKPISAESLAFAERVARRSYWPLYEDEEDAAAPDHGPAAPAGGEGS